jgi:hypothetical protein
MEDEKYMREIKVRMERRAFVKSVLLHLFSYKIRIVVIFSVLAKCRMILTS